jgi:hypothetical protein
MKVQIFQIFFKANASGELVPTDNELFTLASEFAEQYIVDEVEFRDYKNTWVACEVNEQGEPIRCLGLLGLQMRADFPLCRFTDNAAVVKLVQRANDYLHDVHGARGSYALVHCAVDDAPEQRCTDYLDWMKAFELTPADRWAIRVR